MPDHAAVAHGDEGDDSVAVGVETFDQVGFGVAAECGAHDGAHRRAVGGASCPDRERARGHGGIFACRQTWDSVAADTRRGPGRDGCRGPVGVEGQGREGETWTPRS